MNFSKNYCSFDKLYQILDTVFHQSVLQNSDVLFLSHLGWNIPYVWYVKGFFHGNWWRFYPSALHVWPWFQCDSYCDCANKLDRTHRHAIRMVCTKHVIHLPKRQWSKWIRLWRSCPLFPFKQKRWLLNKSDRLRVLNALVSDEVNV